MEQFKRELIEVVEDNLDFTKIPKILTSEIIVINMIDSISSSVRLAHIAQRNPEVFNRVKEFEEANLECKGTNS